MRHIMFVLLIPLVLLQSNTMLVVTAAFHNNRDYIASTLCEKRQDINNNCGGNCVLMKKLEAEKEKEQNAIQLNIHEVLLLENTANIAIQVSASIESPFLPYREPLYNNGYQFPVFHPPLV